MVEEKTKGNKEKLLAEYHAGIEDDDNNDVSGGRNGKNKRKQTCQVKEKKNI